MYTHATFTIKGFVGKAESKTTNGTELATFSVATTKTWKDNQGQRQERTDWFQVTAFRPSLVGRVRSGWITKGRYVEVTGELRENRYTGKDGNERFTLQLMASQVNFLDRKPGGQPDDGSEEFDIED